jgi:hypothetical protein
MLAAGEGRLPLTEHRLRFVAVVVDVARKHDVLSDRLVLFENRHRDGYALVSASASCVAPSNDPSAGASTFSSGRARSVATPTSTLACERGPVG